MFILFYAPKRVRSRACNQSQTKQLFLFYIEIMANIRDLSQCWNETCSIVHSIFNWSSIWCTYQSNHKKSQQTQQNKNWQNNNNSLAKEEKKYTFPIDRLTDQPIESDSSDFYFYGTNEKEIERKNSNRTFAFHFIGWINSSKTVICNKLNPGAWAFGYRKLKIFRNTITFCIFII